MSTEPQTAAVRQDEPFDRASGIGASEIAGVMGISPWLTRWILYAIKRGLIRSSAPTDRMKWGTRLEPAILEGFAEDLGLPYERCQRPIRHAVRTWQYATPDGFFLGANPYPRIPVEIKTAALDQAGEWDVSGTGEDGVPDHYSMQAQWQLSTLELEVCYLAVLVAGNDFRWYEIRRDRETEAILLDEADHFWRDVLAGVAPPMGPSRAATEYLHSRYPRHRTPLRAATDDEVRWLDEYAQVRLALKALEDRRDELKNLLKEAIGESEGLAWPRGQVTWKRTRDRNETNWKALAESQLVGYADDERAALIQEFTEVCHGTRRFLLRGEKEEINA